MSQDCNTTLSSSTSAASRIPHKVRLKANSPLAGLQQLLPDGIPTAQPEPNLGIGCWECYEVILPDTLNTAALAVALFQPNTPTALCKLWLELGVIALPCEWVEANHDA